MAADTPVGVPEVKEFKVTFRCPQYYKAGVEGCYYVFFDETYYKVEPMQSVSVMLSAGRHKLRVYSYPETLADVTEEITVDREIVLSCSINVIKGTMTVFDYQHHTGPRGGPAVRGH